MRKLSFFLIFVGFVLSGSLQYFKVSGIRGAVIPRNDIDSAVIYIMVKGGSGYDPAGKEGLAELLSSLLTKGTDKYSAREFAEKTETLGSTVTAYAEDEALYIYGWSLKEHFDETFSLVADALLHPSFPEKEIAKEKRRLVTSLAQKWDEPGYLASEVFRSKLLAGTAFGREATPKTVERIDRKDLVNYHHGFFNKANVFVVVAGNVSPSRARELVKKYLASMPSGRAAKFLPLRTRTLETRIYIVDRPQAPQTQIRLGYLAPALPLREMVTRKVANYILGGGGFSSRMMKVIRSQEGLTYGIYSYFTGFRRGDYFAVSTFTKNETVGKTVGLILKLIREFREKGATADELRRAKGYYLGGYPLRMETPLDLAYRVLNSELYGYGRDYIHWERKFVPPLGLREVNRAARRYFHEKPVVVVCVGPAEKIKPQLKNFGPLEVIKPPRF